MFDLPHSYHPIPGARGGAEYNGECGIVAWATRGSYWPQVIFLSVGMGVVVQGCIAFAIKHLRPLVISLSLVAQARRINSTDEIILMNSY